MAKKIQKLKKRSIVHRVEFVMLGIEHQEHKTVREVAMAVAYVMRM